MATFKLTGGVSYFRDKLINGMIGRGYNRRIVLGARMMGLRGQVQKEGEVIHVIAQRLEDLSPLLASVGQRGDVSNIYQVRASSPRTPNDVPA
ncbi:hypothetical protein [Sphingobium sp.]|uniref:hypothetical protein n=1 Tax=Sphingobium sp. TaxID=1912891 RepID=UPI003BB6F7AF